MSNVIDVEAARAVRESWRINGLDGMAAAFKDREEALAEMLDAVGRPWHHPIDFSAMFDLFRAREEILASALRVCDEDRLRKTAVIEAATKQVEEMAARVRAATIRRSLI